MSDHHKPTKIVEHEQALSVYLTDMLTESETESTKLETVIPETITTQSLNHAAVTGNEALTTETSEIVSNEPVQVLLLQLHGLKLAISVQELSGILKWPETPMSKMPGKPSWYLGLISNPQQYTQVIDIGHIMLPEQVTDTLSPKYIVLIDDNRWGLACEKVSKIVTVGPGEVKWRKQSGQRKWLAGTLLDEMYSIIDVTELAILLNAN